MFRETPYNVHIYVRILKHFISFQEFDEQKWSANTLWALLKCNFFLYYITKLIYPPVQSLKFMYYSSMIFRCVASLCTINPFSHSLTPWLTRCFFHWLTLKMLWHPDHMECYASIGPSDLGTLCLLLFVYVYFATGKWFWIVFIVITK